MKLSPDYPDANHHAIVPAILETGIDGVNFGNTRRIADPRLSQGAGGVSGPSLFPGVLAEIRALRRILGPRLALVATGGIDSPDRALAALEAGADAVGYFTASPTCAPAPPRGRPIRRAPRRPARRRQDAAARGSSRGPVAGSSRASGSTARTRISA